ncbi:UPF0158 family protein [Levilactobacillus tujiorum]|uniref:DUF1642 domain-containing protein n=1 Tax=Levilactobacillus tujiorum TaxID=2912243 RepID=A0ABX1L6J7_9LACO|nr:UPF0158 family protein [Levilactobacillus tujiorum]MCH5465674.1 UPF0158 family protein [Levilactobacillus tujiorum]NLR12806.1 hypothetical protein [Lactobacillus sp. HBUAS51387]NLR30686.1 hypothetical protein [Levilactobacillus tujiorum]
MKVKFSEVMDAVESAGDDITFYYAKDTQTVVSVMEDGDDGIADDIEEHWDRYIQLPSKYEVNDYHIMEEFIWNLSDEQQQNQLENAISGRGAFRYFRDVVAQFDLTQDWYIFRDTAYEKIGREWCAEHQITAE